MARLFFTLGLAITVVFCSCTKESQHPENPVPEAEHNNVAYGNDTRQVMDIFLPAGRTESQTKTLFMIHGGGWVEGDKQDFADVIAYLKKELPQYALVNVNYRLALNGQTNIFPVQEDDIKRAVAFYLEKSKAYKVSKDILMGGASAGAHLAMLHSYKNDPEHHVKAVIDFYGPTDLVALWNAGLLQQLSLLKAIGVPYTDNPQIYSNSSPVNFITAQSPPTIALQGGADFIVVPDQTNRLIEKLKQFGVKHQHVFYPAESHGWTGLNLLDSYSRIISFIKAEVK